MPINALGILILKLKTHFLTFFLTSSGRDKSQNLRYERLNWEDDLLQITELLLWAMF